MIEKPAMEKGFIKCYPRTGKGGKIPGYQRRILLKSDGELKGCPGDPDPVKIVVLHENDFDQILAALEKVNNEEKQINEATNKYQELLKTKDNNLNALNERIDSLKLKLDDKTNEINNLTKEKAELQGKIRSSENWKDQFLEKNEKLEKALVFVGLQRGIIGEYKGRGVWNRLRNPEPEDLKKLNEPLDI